MAELSNKKIIFLTIVGVVVLLLAIGLFSLNNKDTKVVTAGTVNVWINEGTTDDFQKLVAGFHAADPENRKIQIIPTRQSSTTVAGYTSLLLRAISNGQWPDIFMVPRGEYAPLESQIAKIPSSVLNVTDFENRFDSVFSELIVNEKSEDGKSTVQSLLGVPLGYETLGVFYNRSLFRSGVPTTWTAVEELYGNFPQNIFPTNLGLRRAYVPNIADILPIFFADAKIFSYKNLENITSPFKSYYEFGNLGNGTTDLETDIYTSKNSLRETESTMKTAKSTTFDEFLRGNIGMIVGYPSLANELALSVKRVGADANMTELIYTGRLPKMTQQSSENIAKYTYFAISNNAKTPDASVKFLQYLMTPEAQQIAMEIFPYQIPAQIEFHAAAQNSVLSPTFARAKLDAFIPSAGMKVTTFDYGAKTTFESLLDANWEDFGDNTALSSFGATLVSTISCEIADNPELCKK